MRHRLWLWFGALTWMAALAAAGDIQVSCEPGLRVYLDGQLVGTSGTLEDGLFLLDVPDGLHTLRVEKDGFEAQTFEVEASDVPIEVKVEDLVPAVAQTQDDQPAPAVGGRAVGSLVVTSAPQNCTVEIDGRAEAKTTPQMSIGGLVAGEHTISFSKSGFETVTGVVRVEPGMEVVVRGNLIDGEVELIHQGKGSLRVLSRPTRCTVHFLGERRDKNHQRLNLTHIPAGEHPILVAWRGMERAATITIKDGWRTIVAVSFMPGEEPVVISYEPL